jgi:hypothetical protein
MYSLEKTGRRRNGNAETTPPPRRVRTEETRPPLVLKLQHDVASSGDVNHDEAISDDHEWQAQHIVGERQTSLGLEYEVSVRKTLWMPSAKLDTKMVKKYRAGRRAATRVRTRWSLRLQKTGKTLKQRQ